MLALALTLMIQVDPGVVTTRQTITPAGAQAVLTGRVQGVTFGRDSNDVWVLVRGRPSELVHLAWADNRVLGRVALDSLSSAGIQSIALDPVTYQPYVSFGAQIIDTRPPRKEKNKKPKKNKAGLIAPPMRPVIRFAVADGDSVRTLSELQSAGETTGPLAIAKARDAHGHRTALVTLTDDDTLAVIDIQTGAVVRKLATGIAPFGVVTDSAGTVAYVSNWGGRSPRAGERWARTGDDTAADRVIIDSRGVAASGTVTRFDLATGARTTIAVGLHPTAMVWDEPRHRIYVADGNADSVSVIETTTNTVVETISVNPFAGHPFGVAPTAVAVSPDGATLFVACGGLNAIAVVDVERQTVRGLIPTAWYPASLAVSRDGRSIAVGAILGVGSGSAASLIAALGDKFDEKYFPHGPRPDARYVHSYRGTVSVIPIPDDAQLASYTAAVAANDRLSLTSEVVDSAAHWPKIDHVVYVVRENRSYDQVLGDIGKGNSDSSLTMYGRDVTPNAHRLAEQFVLLDNFYATGGNSGDGHQWVTQANETEYTIWPGYGSRSYPKNGNDPLAYSKSGFIWNAAAEKGRTIAIFGEYVGYLPKRKHESDSVALFELAKYRRGATYVGRFATRAPITAIQRYVVPDYPAYGTQIPDVARARIFARHVAHWDSTGAMPNFVIVQLPCDHTAGMTPGWTTPSAMVADNDLALGQVVDALSHSRFWGSMAIFIVEDDAQGGVDHVDGHRTVALAVSPFIRHGTIDHTFYSQQSFLRTIEGVLGLRHLTMFDLVANDLRASFSDTADLSPYTARQPIQSIYEPNAEIEALSGPAKRAAITSAAMNWREPDAVPAMTLNKILWHDVRGWATPYPAPTHAVFAPLAAPDRD